MDTAPVTKRCGCAFCEVRHEATKALARLTRVDTPDDDEDEHRES